MLIRNPLRFPKNFFSMQQKLHFSCQQGLVFDQVTWLEALMKLHLTMPPRVLTFSDDYNIERRSICNLQKQGITYLRKAYIAKRLF